jgi:S1-C subfamily serine protease
MKKFIITFLIITIFAKTGLALDINVLKQIQSINANWEYYNGTEQSIREYFDDNNSKLDPIEGFFTLSIKYYDEYGNLLKNDDNWSKIAIVKDNNSLTREFIEVNLQTDGFPKYAITADFTKASNGVLYLSKQFSKDGKFTNENYTWDKDLEMLFTEKVAYSNDNIKYIIKKYYTKVYPKKSSIVEVKKSKFYGTCFAITSEGLFVTNYHMIDGAKTIKIRGINSDFDNTYNVKVIVSDKNNDLALIQVDDLNFTSLGTIPFTIKTTLADVGENVFVLGYPLRATMGDEIKLTNGIVSSKTGFQGDITSYQISAPVQSGNSGGPVFDKQGNLIGIINSKHSGAENASYAIKSNYLNGLIELLPNTTKLQKINLLSGKLLTQQVQLVKKFVYIIETE